MISLLKRRLLMIRPNVLLFRYSLRLRLNFQLLPRWNLMTSGNRLQHCSRNPVSCIHYHLPLSSNVQTYCFLLLLTSSVSLFVKAACLRVWNLQYYHLCSRDLMQTFYNSRTLDPSRAIEGVIEDYWEDYLLLYFLIIFIIYWLFIESRKARESHLIDKAMTLEPHGLNRRDELL